MLKYVYAIFLRMLNCFTLQQFQENVQLVWINTNWFSVRPW